MITGTVSKGNRKRFWLLAAALIIATATACGGSGGSGGGSAEEVPQLGADLEPLNTHLHTDPAFAEFEINVELGNDASGNIVEDVQILMPDSYCPGKTADSCPDIINQSVKHMLTAPVIDNHPSIEVTIHAFRAIRCNQNVNSSCKDTPAKPPLVRHTVQEWRELLEE
jgi:hypothetical protein